MRISDWSSDVCSSDLSRRNRVVDRIYDRHRGRPRRGARTQRPQGAVEDRLLGDRQRAMGMWRPRSEEHTSELQSLMRTSYAVFCLKKKKFHNSSLTNTPLSSDDITHTKHMQR